MAFLLCFLTSPCLWSIKEPGIQPPVRWLFWVASQPFSQSAGSPIKVSSLPQPLVSWVHWLLSLASCVASELGLGNTSFSCSRKMVVESPSLMLSARIPYVFEWPSDIHTVMFGTKAVKYLRVRSLQPNSVLAVLLSCFSFVWLFATLWTVAHQAPLSTGFSRQEYWSGLPFPVPGDLPNPGIEPESLMSPTLTAGFLTTSAT